MKQAHPLISRLLDYRSNKLAARISTHLPIGADVLDVGCGDMRVGQAVLVKRPDVKWVGVDTIDYHGTALDFHLNRENECPPFADRSFDVVLLAFVLHHCTRHEPLLSECARVCRRRIVLCEDVLTEHIGSMLFTLIHDVVVNKIMERRVRCPGNFNTREGWLRALNQKGFRCVGEEAIKTHVLALVNQTIFIFDQQRGQR